MMYGFLVYGLINSPNDFNLGLPGLRKCDEIEARTVVFGRLLSISSVFYVGNIDYPRFRRYCRYLM